MLLHYEAKCGDGICWEREFQLNTSICRVCAVFNIDPTLLRLIFYLHVCVHSLSETLLSATANMGRPYRWVQWMSGLQFLDASDAARKETTAGQHSLDHIMARLRARVHARMALRTQLAALGRWCQFLL